MVGYEVFRDSGGGSNFLAAADPTCGMETSPAPQSCTITGLTAGQVYQLRVLAINEVGDGELSDILEAKSATVPAKITSLSNTGASTLPNQAYVIFNFQAEITRIFDGQTVTYDFGGTAAAPV